MEIWISCKKTMLSRCLYLTFESTLANGRKKLAVFQNFVLVWWWARWAGPMTHSLAVTSVTHHQACMKDSHPDSDIRHTRSFGPDTQTPKSGSSKADQRRCSAMRGRQWNYIPESWCSRSSTSLTHHRAKSHFWGTRWFMAPAKSVQAFALGLNMFCYNQIKQTNSGYGWMTQELLSCQL